MRRLMLSLVVATAGSLAQAGVIESASSRTTFVDANTGTGVHNTDSGTGPSIYGLFDDSRTADALDAPLFAQGNAYQSTNINPGHYFGILDTNASADAGPAGMDIVDGYAQTTFSVDFTLTTAMDFSIVGNLYAVQYDTGDTALSKIVIENVGSGGSPTQVIGQQTNDIGFFNLTGTLLPGSYQLEAEALSSSSRVFVSSWSEARAGVEFNMTLTPEPAALAMLAVGALFVQRRRRQAGRTA